MRLPGLLALPLLLHAQAPTALVPIPAGTTRQIILQVATPPVPDDTFYYDISTKRLSVVLVTPDGARITQATARQAGFDWGDIDVRPPIGSTDAGAAGCMHFLRTGRAGTYVVEFTAPAGVQNASAGASFGTEQDKYSVMMSRAPGYQKLGPYRLTPGQNPIEIVLDRDEQAAIFDLVTPAGGQLSLTLPNGQTIDRSIGEQARMSWEAAARENIDPPGAMAGISGFLLRDRGMHDVVMLQNAAQGRYQIRAVGAPVQVTAAYIPLGRILKGATDALTSAPVQAPAGQTRIQPYALPGYDAKVGDNVTATIGIVGDALTNPQFVVLMEYRQILSRQPLQYSAPVVEKVPTAFIRDSRGLYSGTIIPRRSGVLRVGVQVSGMLSNGQTFSDETVLSSLTVFP